MTSGGLPHSGTRGSTPADGSPRLVAAFRALHRPSTPRHPPCARRSSAAMLAHDAEPTGSTHVHHSALVNVPEATRASPEPSAATATNASREPRLRLSSAQQKRPDTRRAAHPRARSPDATRSSAPPRRAAEWPSLRLPAFPRSPSFYLPRPSPCQGAERYFGAARAARALSPGYSLETEQRPDLYRTAPRPVPAALS